MRIVDKALPVAGLPVESCLEQGPVQALGDTGKAGPAGLLETTPPSADALPGSPSWSGGSPHLNNPDNANRIRALLLAGVRAAILWRQSGGGRLTLLLRRNPLLRETRRLLASLE